MKKLIYFTAAAVPTVTEAGHIAIFEAIDGLETCVRNVQKIASTDNPEPADYVCNATGSDFPTNYPEDPYVRVTAAAPPAPTVAATQKVITSGVEFAGPDKTGTYANGWTPTIAAGAVTAMLAT